MDKIVILAISLELLETITTTNLPHDFADKGVLNVLGGDLPK